MIIFSHSPPHKRVFSVYGVRIGLDVFLNGWLGLELPFLKTGLSLLRTHFIFKSPFFLHLLLVLLDFLSSKVGCTLSLFAWISICFCNSVCVCFFSFCLRLLSWAVFVRFFVSILYMKLWISNIFSQFLLIQFGCTKTMDTTTTTESKKKMSTYNEWMEKMERSKVED